MNASPEILSPFQHKANRVIWGSIVIAALVDFLLMRMWGLTLKAPFLNGVLIIVAFCALLALFYRYVRRNDSLALLAHAFNQLICGCFVILISSYLAAYVDRPLVDDTLFTLDKKLGFNWFDYLHWVDSKPLLAKIFPYAYDSWGLEYLGFVFLLFFNRSAHGQRVLMVSYFAAMISVVLSGIFPAVGLYVHYNIDNMHFQNFHPDLARVHEELILSLRDHSRTSLPYPGEGIITFPSYHTVLALVLIYASVPYRYLFLLAVPINVAMICATPLEGGHYIVDVIGGVIVACLCIVISERILPKNVGQPI